MSTFTVILKNKPYDFLNWLYFRLKNKYREDKKILNRISDIIHNYKIVNTDIDSETIDELCEKVIPLFSLDNEYGYSEDEKNQFRSLVKATAEYIGVNLLKTGDEEINLNEKDFEFELMGQ